MTSTADGPTDGVAEETDHFPAVAYLVSQYPALSHTFIEREVRALREIGVPVVTFSVRPADPATPFSEATRREAASTVSILGRPLLDYLRAHARLIGASPRAWSRGLASAVAAGCGIRGRVWQVFYFGEAVVLEGELYRRGIRHVHAHFANNAADVARLATVVSRWRSPGEPAARWTFSLHGPADFDTVPPRELGAKARSASAVACISEYARERVAALLEPDHHGKLAVVHMSVYASDYPAITRARDEDPDGVRILFVGRLVDVKQPENLVEAVRRLRDQGLPVRAAFVGNGPLRDVLAARIASAGLDEAVQLVGGVGQDVLPQWYGWADVFCLPSRAEGVPVVLMEAMATELPVVSTAITGIPELVDDGVSGLLVDPADLDALVTALADLVRDPERRRRMGEAGRRTVLRDFDPWVNARRLVASWGEIAEA